MPAPQPTRAAGAILAFCILAGAIVGVSQNQPSLGTLIGAGVGGAIALALWLRDRRGA